MLAARGSKVKSFADATRPPGRAGGGAEFEPSHPLLPKQAQGGCAVASVEMAGYILPTFMITLGCDKIFFCRNPVAEETQKALARRKKVT